MPSGDKEADRRQFIARSNRDTISEQLSRKMWNTLRGEVKPRAGVPESDLAPVKTADPVHVDFADSWIDGLDYDEGSGDLAVSLNGETYVYPEVPKDVFEEFANAPDPGAYYNEDFHPIFHSRR